MERDPLKMACAKRAAKKIKNGMTIGLGGGSTISYLIEVIMKQNLQVKVVTPSLITKTLCRSKGLDVLDTSIITHLDVAFDGCDQVDEQLNALKSGGGIHTLEKLVARMADTYILLVDESKFVKRLTFDQPVVLEVLAEAEAYAEYQAAKLGGKAVMRQSAAKDGYTVSDNGHLLMDVFFQRVTDIDALDRSLRAISGVIDTSLFCGVATHALVAGINGMHWIKKPE